jgi:hypothetical protein
VDGRTPSFVGIPETTKNGPKIDSSFWVGSTSVGTPSFGSAGASGSPPFGSSPSGLTPSFGSPAAYSGF